MTWVTHCYAVLAIVSNSYPPLQGRLPTRYSPVRNSSKKSKLLSSAFYLHVLGTPPAFVLSQDQTLIIKVRTILRLLSSICLLAYCLLVKNVCCLELNQDALHIWFVYSLFSFQRSTLPRSNFYIITNFRLNVKNFFEKVFLSCFARLLLSVVTTSISYHLVCYLSTTFLLFFQTFFERFEIKNCYLIIDFWIAQLCDSPCDM